MTTYQCRSCGRTVDPDLEPSSAEPRLCPDCAATSERESRT